MSHVTARRHLRNEVRLDLAMDLGEEEVATAIFDGRGARGRDQEVERSGLKVVDVDAATLVRWAKTISRTGGTAAHRRGDCQ